MIKKCTLEFVAELEAYILDGKMNSLKITKKDNEFFAEYELQNEPVEVDMSTKLYASSVLKEFGTMLLLDKVHDFSMFYKQLEQKCVVSQSYKITSQEITRDVKLASLKEQLQTVLVLVKDTGLADTKVKEIFEKVTKPAVNNQNQKQRKDSNTRYQETNIENVIGKILEVI